MCLKLSTQTRVEPLATINSTNFSVRWSANLTNLFVNNNNKEEKEE